MSHIPANSLVCIKQAEVTLRIRYTLPISRSQRLVPSEILELVADKFSDCWQFASFHLRLRQTRKCMDDRFCQDNTCAWQENYSFDTMDTRQSWRWLPNWPWWSDCGIEPDSLTCYICYFEFTISYVVFRIRVLITHNCFEIWTVWTTFTCIVGRGYDISWSYMHSSWALNRNWPLEFLLQPCAARLKGNVNEFYRHKLVIKKLYLKRILVWKNILICVCVWGGG